MNIFLNDMPICCNVIQFGSAPIYATIFCRNAAGRLVWYQLGERRPIIGSSFGWNLEVACESFFVVFPLQFWKSFLRKSISVFSFFFCSHSSFVLEDIKTEATTFMDEAVCNHKLRHSPGFFFLDCFVEFCNIFLGSSHEGFKACCFEVSKVSLQSLESFTKILDMQYHIIALHPTDGQTCQDQDAGSMNCSFHSIETMTQEFVSTARSTPRAKPEMIREVPRQWHVPQFPPLKSVCTTSNSRRTEEEVWKRNRFVLHLLFVEISF